MDEAKGKYSPTQLQATLHIRPHSRGLGPPLLRGKVSAGGARDERDRQ